jgi:hypothetical protein
MLPVSTRRGRTRAEPSAPHAPEAEEEALQSSSLLRDIGHAAPAPRRAPGPTLAFREA